MFAVLLLVLLIQFYFLRSDLAPAQRHAVQRSDTEALRGDLTGLVALVAELADAQLVPRVRRELEVCAVYAALP
jgi:hypothetical protein